MLSQDGFSSNKKCSVRFMRLKTNQRTLRHWCLPRTMRSAADETLSTPVCTIQTYFPLCFSWMFLIIKSPDELCWKNKKGMNTLFFRKHKESWKLWVATPLGWNLCLERRPRWHRLRIATVECMETKTS